MTKPAAIEGQLVSIKNVSTHKSACLTIHVPEEYALKVIEAFGWPTMVAPVPVAIAKLDLNARPELKGGPNCKKAAILSNDASFRFFLSEQNGATYTEEDAANYIRQYCNVESRRELDHNDEAAKKFKDLDLEFGAWRLQ